MFETTLEQDHTHPDPNLRRLQELNHRNHRQETDLVDTHEEILQEDRKENTADYPAEGLIGIRRQQHLLTQIYPRRNLDTDKPKYTQACTSRGLTTRSGRENLLQTNTDKWTVYLGEFNYLLWQGEVHTTQPLTNKHKNKHGQHEHPAT